MPRKEVKPTKTTPKKHTAIPAPAVAKKTGAKKAGAAVAVISKAVTPATPLSTVAAPAPAAIQTTPSVGAAVMIAPEVLADPKSTKGEPMSESGATDSSSNEPPTARDISGFVSDLHSPMSHVRERAAVELGRSENRAACEPLINALSDSDADVARETAVALGVLGVPAASNALTQVLRNADGYHHAVVRAAAAASLGALRDPDAIECLVDAVYDSQAEVSAEATRSLGEYVNQDRAIDALIDVVRNHNNYFLPLVRRVAVLALGKSSTERARSELRYVANDMNEDAVIRTDAARLSYSA